MAKHVCTVVFLLYIVSILCLTFLVNRRAHSGYNLIPFAEPIRLLRSKHYEPLSLMVMNVFLFIPYGILAPMVLRDFHTRCTGHPRIIEHPLLIGVVFIVLIEIFQPIFRRGIFDIDDILCNTLGVFIGYGLFLVGRYFLMKRRKNDTR